MKYLCLYVTTIVVMSCSNKREVNKKEYYSNGCLKSETMCIDDTIKQGRALYYDSNQV